jgi:hypothetical protein
MKFIHSTNMRMTGLLGIVTAASLASICFAPAAQARDAWSAAIARTPAPHEGCFHATYPSTQWVEVACHVAPHVLMLPARGAGANTVGDRDDYAAVVSGTVISSGVGFFPQVKGLKTETGDNGPNTYSLQLNSNLMSGSPACNGAADPSQCQAWEQFIMYSVGPVSVFMQYWLINYNATCPAGWQTFESDCYTFSRSVHVPPQTIKQLKYMSLSGTAVAGGRDAAVLTTKTDAYTTMFPDNVVDLAGFWTGSEFNVLGDDGGTEAVFNAGTKLTVELDLTDGQTAAPICQANDGTSGETNNLNLGKCTTAGGTTPSISFVESLKK